MQPPPRATTSSCSETAQPKTSDPMTYLRLPVLVCLWLVAACDRSAPASEPPAAPTSNAATTASASSEAPTSTASGSEPEPDGGAAPEGRKIGMANPASKNCGEKGGKLEIMREAAGEFG